jgi:UDPglucose 6-dehydrogenase
MNKISVIGCGRLGLCYALLLEEAGYDVLAIDSNINLIRMLNTKTLGSHEPKVNELMKNAKNIKYDIDLELIKDHGEMILLFVPTPNGGGEDYYDHTILANCLKDINNMKVKDKNIVIVSTINPTWLSVVGENILEDCKNCTLSYSPEFIAQGTIIDDYKNCSHILIGSEGEVGEKIAEINKKVNKNPNVVVSQLSPLEAEITKLAINGFLCTKISYANMIGDYCKSVGANPDKVLKAVGSDERIGNKYLKYGLAYGGECLPRDALALSLAIKKKGLNPLISIASHEYNRFHSNLLSQDLMKDLQKKKTDKYTFEGINFREDTDVPIITESPRLIMADNLATAGVNVTIKDKKHIIDLVKLKYGAKFTYNAR